MRPYIRLLSLTLPFFLISSCGIFNPSAGPSEDSVKMGGLQNGLMFAGIDPTVSPWQSTVYRMDFKTNIVTKLLTGESGDPVFFNVQDEILFFNRSFDSQNFRIISSADGKINASNQLKVAGGSVGDPHDVLALTSHRILLAHFNLGRLIIIDKTSGSLVRDLNVDWDLPAGVPLRPESLALAQFNGEEYIYVVHQAMGLKDGLVVADGSQRVFVLKKKTDGEVEPVDLDLKTPKVQGILIKGSFPVVIRHKDEVLLFSLCSRMVAEASQTAAHKCAGAVERIDPKTQTAQMLWDLNQNDVYMNGMTTAGDSANIFYASVEHCVNNNQFEKKVFKFNIAEKKLESVYSYAKDSGGFWGLFFDSEQKNLYIGDTSSSTIGKFTIVGLHGQKGEVFLDHVPYAGAAINYGL